MSNLLINKNQVNRIVVTVSERSKLVNPFYLMVFTSKFSTTDVTINAAFSDLSNATIRYNLFELEEKVNPNGIDGEVFLVEGEWSYKIYESNIKTLDVNQTTGEVLQQGLIIVK